MKRLLIALAAAVAVLTASAKVTDTQSFETSFSDFEPSVAAEDESELVAYDNNGPDFDAPYNFADFGSKYLSLDTGDATLWRTNTAVGNVYFDMALQFNPSASEPQLDTDDPTKILLYQNAESNLVILAGTSSSDRTPTSYVTTTKVAPGTWARVTVSSSLENDGYVFTVRVNGTPLETAGGVHSFPSLTAATEISQIGFAGSGALDDFVARTTDPFIQNPVAMIGGEGYASFADALADDPTAIVQLQANASMPAPLAYGESISVKLNGNTLSGITTGSLIALASTSGDVTTYTASYFPRTATAGQDGTPANPYELADADDLQALKAAFETNATFRAASYKLVADIDATDLGYWDGIGTQGTANSGLNGGTLDGARYTISNLKFSTGKYRGFFNRMDNATVKDLTINVVGFADTDAEEHGYAAFVGNMDANTTFLRCAATGTLGTTEKPAMHTTAGIAVKVASSGAFVDCTNYVNIVCSLNDNPKIGGIVGLVNGGAVTVTNCWNFGNLTVTPDGVKDQSNGAGGLVGYTGGNLTVYGGGNTGTIAWSKTTEGHTNEYAVKVGTIIGMVTSSKTATVSGGVVAQADAAPAGSFAKVNGLTYATVDNNVATFVPDAELTAGNTYVLQQNVAASETPVYTFNAAGTISFDTALGYTFAGTVAVDTTTLVPAEPVTEGTVTTYGATAGVAAVDNFAYATFEEAVAALEGETEDDFVTLLADVTTTLSADTTLKVKLNGKNLTPIKGADDVIIGYNTVDGVTTYTATEGVASLNGTWYATFEDAYSHASAVTDTMVVKVSGDFNPVLDGTRTFATVTFTNTNESVESLVINTAYNSYTFKASNWVFPKNATLSLSGTYTLISANGGTLNIPDGTVITANGQTALDNVDLVTGDGKLIAPPNPTYFLYYSNLVKNKVLTNALWTGTFQVAGNYAYTLDLSALGNSESTVLFNGFTVATFGASNSTYEMDIELAGDGLTLNGDYTRTFTFAGDLSGAGSLNITAMGAGGSYVFFAGDTSDFAGSVNLASTTARVVFGGVTAGGGGSITVASGKSVTIPATSSWTASDLVVVGNLVANGPVTISGSLWGNSGTGVYQANTNAAAVTAADSWNGTYVIGWDPAESTYFNINDFGVNADAKIVFDGTWPSGAYLGNGSAGAYTVSSELQLDSPIVIDNGFSGSGNVVTFAKLSGSANLTTRRYNYVTDSVQCYYAISWLENYTGELIVRDAASLDIGIVNVPSGTSLTDRIVKVTKSKYYDSSVAEGVVTGELKLYVDGVDTGKTLTYVADGAQGEGLYYVVPQTYVAQIGEDGEKYVSLRAAIEAATAGATVNLLADDRVSFSMDNLEVAISKALTIDGHGFTVYGVNDYNYYSESDGGHDHDIYVSGNGNVTMRNLTLSDFGGASYVNQRTYPIWTGLGFTGTLTLEGVTVTNYNRTALNLNNGTVLIDGCTLAGDTSPRNVHGAYFQNGIGVRSANVTVTNTTVTGMGAYDPENEDSNVGPCMQVTGDGSITVKDGSYAGQYAAVVAAAATGSIAIEGGSFTGDLAVEESSAGSISITGGTFSVNPSDYCATGYEAKESAGVWTVSAKSGESLEPGQSSKSYPTPAAAEAAAAGVEITVPAAVAGELDSAAQTTYKAMFEKKVVSDGAGGYKVEVALTDTAVEAIQTQADADAAEVIEDLTDAEVTLTTTPGLYYSFKYGTSLENMTEGARTLATGSSLELTRPTTENATAGFYKVLVNITDK